MTAEPVRILAIETSSRIGGVAVASGPRLLAQEQFTADLRHAGQLLGTMDRLVRAQGWPVGRIDQVYVSAGPGSFTGLRIATAAAKALAFAWPQIRIVAVPSTDVIAQNALQADAAERLANVRQVAVVIDAQRQQLYAALYERRPDEAEPDGQSSGDGQFDEPVARFRTVRPAAVISATQLLAVSRKPLLVLGPALVSHRKALTQEGVFFLDESYWQPRPDQVHRCGWRRAQAGQFTTADELAPLYLRRPEAVERWEHLHGKT
ncbi:MAG: tRNA (adenosine(37)-N6)-threonylcarbamoyltransferase complex dimerization subunit type 1 TsaB [Sedimentisphaerales bacterium]|nr:tRNA (adenosine(37)-N6)-threonylcarbamoyltransferase complex dimerization subunit type 1 TsaB [Sedimentisphaerales bacterium]